MPIKHAIWKVGQQPALLANDTKVASYCGTIEDVFPKMECKG